MGGWLRPYVPRSDAAAGSAYLVRGAACLVLGACLATAPAFLADAWAEDKTEIQQRIGSGDPVAGGAKSKDELCQGCHGETGLATTEAIPKLAGQYAAYLIKQLHDFQALRRRHRIMNPMAEGLAEADIADISAYFASQSRPAGKASAGDEAARNLFLYGDMEREIPACAGCHELGGQGRLSGGVAYPRIGGQSRRYLRTQLLDWKFGSRANGADGAMNKIASGLSEEEIAALAEYLSSL